MRDLMHARIADAVAYATTEDAITIFAFVLAELARKQKLDKRLFQGRVISALDGAWRYQNRMQQ
jgi:hypothetical protein